MTGLSYIWMMHFGNDVIYFKKCDQHAIYGTLKKALCDRLLQAPSHLIIRMLPYMRLVIEPLFAYNHFEDSDEIDVEEYDSEEDEESDDEKKKTKKKKVVIKTHGYQI